MKDFFAQVESWEVWLFVGALVFLSFYFGRQLDFENMFKQDAASPVHMGALPSGLGTLQGVEVVDIPERVYESLPEDGKFKRYLTGNHKYLFLFTYPGCPYARAFSGAFERLFTQKGFDEYYRKRVISVGRTTTISCPGQRDMNCATAWVYQTCFGNLCIFNPVRKQVVVDHSQNAHQLEALLEKYKEW